MQSTAQTVWRWVPSASARSTWTTTGPDGQSLPTICPPSTWTGKLFLNCFYQIQGLIVDSTFRYSCAENLQLASRYPEMLITADHLSLCIRRLERVKLNQFLIGEI